MISLRGVSLGYGQRRLIRDANADLRAGTVTALVGRNGSGKSTLLRAVGGLNTAYTGAIEVGEGQKARDIARQLSYVTTERVRITNLRCRDVVAMGRAPYTDWFGHLSSQDLKSVDESLEAVGMEGYAGRTMDRMSDGECQRIMIARALAQSTPVMLLDEPTSFLDLPNRYELAELLSRLAHEQGKCILFSTHELDIALGHCDNIMLISTPDLITLPVAEMRESGHLQKTFGKYLDI